jgi:hypothetical protein
MEYVRKPASLRLGMLPGLAALRGLTCVNVLLTLATEKESPQALVSGCVSGTVLSSKRAKKLFNLAGSKTSISPTGLVFFCSP